MDGRHEASAGRMGCASAAESTIKTRALQGVQAPEGDRMEVLGAWLDDDDREFVVPSKLNRAQHIHEYGFS